VLAKVTDDTSEITITNDAGEPASDVEEGTTGEENGHAQQDKLTASAVEGFVQGNLVQLKPEVPSAPLRLFFDHNKLEDLWLAVTWG
jgi:hypothetical protein